MNPSPVFHPDVLNDDWEQCATRLASALEEAVARKLRRRGLVVAVSGGIDSACVLGLAVRALGPRRVHALLLPELDSSPTSSALGRELCERFGVTCETVDLTAALSALGCYRIRDAAVRSVYPEFEPSMRWKLVLGTGRLDSDLVNYFCVVVETPTGEQRFRLPPKAYLDIVAATNMKQRTRKLVEYTRADQFVFAVAGTPNRLEYDQGFFVKLGDGAADVKPIASLYKTQVYALSRHLGVIEPILQRAPTTDTFSLDQSQEDFYFAVDYRRLDLLLWAKNHGVSVEESAAVTGLTGEQVQRVFLDIDQKRRTTAYLHAPPLLLEPVTELPGLP